MAIQLRRGNSADYDASKMLQGEPAIFLDTDEMVFKGTNSVKLLGTNSQTLTSAEINNVLANLGAYKAGDSITLSPNTLQFAGVAQNTSTIRFTIPLTKPIVASNASISGSVGVRCNGTWSDSFDVSTATQTCTVSQCGLVVVLAFSSARSYLTQNHAAIVQPSNLTITFS